MTRAFATAVMVTILLSAVCSGLPITIRLEHGSQAEQQTKQNLEHLLATYDLSHDTFTRSVVIDEKSIPHSHPVLTLHTRHRDADDILLSTYVHEQLHWHLTAHAKDTRAAEDDLRKLYPKVPVGFPEGARDEESTYLHLIDCSLEIQADRQLMGAERAAKVAAYLAGDHYTWVYKTIASDQPRIAAIVAQRHLAIP
jgi:hypothetical protein